MAGFKAPNSISSKDSNVRLGGSEPRAGKNQGFENIKPILDKNGQIKEAYEIPVTMPHPRTRDHTDLASDPYDSDESAKRMRQDVLPFQHPRHIDPKKYKQKAKELERKKNATAQGSAEQVTDAMSDKLVFEESVRRFRAISTEAQEYEAELKYLKSL